MVTVTEPYHLDSVVLYKSRELTCSHVCALQVLALMEQFQKVTLWFGGDSRSWETRRQFARKLNEKRSFLIR